MVDHTGKQIQGSTPKWGIAGALNQDGVFDGEFKRAFVGDGSGIASNDTNKRDAYTNTIREYTWQSHRNLISGGGG